MCIKVNVYDILFCKGVIICGSNQNRKIHFRKQKETMLNTGTISRAIEYKQKCSFKVGTRFEFT